MGTFFAVLGALVLHCAFLLFGGVFFPEPERGPGKLQEVELVEPEAARAEPPPPDSPAVASKPDEVPDAEEVIRNLEQPAADSAPALDAASLAALAEALSGQPRGGDFSTAVSFASGGRIGGTGSGSGLDQAMDQAFSLAEIDQKPRAMFQAEPVFPNEMRGRRVQGTATVIFVVDANGKVADPRIERSSHPAFDKPAVDAVRQWTFEPGV
jgi:protein TonB